MGCGAGTGGNKIEIWDLQCPYMTDIVIALGGSKESILAEAFHDP
jgi:hypothetical protein